MENRVNLFQLCKLHIQIRNVGFSGKEMIMFRALEGQLTKEIFRELVMMDKLNLNARV